jgi:hypothetical protein
MSTRPETPEISGIAVSNTELRRRELRFEHSTVRFEVGPVGTVARINHDDGRRDYAGPLDEATIAALLEVSD